VFGPFIIFLFASPNTKILLMFEIIKGFQKPTS